MSKIVAVEVTPHALRAAEIANYKNPRKQQVVRTAELALADGIAGESTARDPDALTEALEALWEENGFSTKRVGLVVSGRGFIVREAESREATPKDALANIPYENPKALPSEPQGFIVDFLPTELTEIKGEEILRGLVISAPKAPISDLAFATKRAKLSLEFVEFAPLGVLRYVQTHIADPGESYIILNVRDESTDFMTVKNGIPLSVRTISKGLDSKSRKWGNEPAMPAIGIADQRVRGRIDEVQLLAGEIGLTIQSQDRDVFNERTKIYLTGPRADDAELKKLLTSSLSMKTESLFIEGEDEDDPSTNSSPRFDQFVAMCGGMR